VRCGDVGPAGEAPANLDRAVEVLGAGPCIRWVDRRAEHLDRGGLSTGVRHHDDLGRPLYERLRMGVEPLRGAASARIGLVVRSRKARTGQLAQVAVVVAVADTEVRIDVVRSLAGVGRTG